MNAEADMGEMDLSLRQKVVRQVRSEIMCGQSPPGMMYSVPSLALGLGVSTTPVREALLELSRSGLVEPVKNRGFKVVEPTVKELHELFDLRDVLEIHAAVLLAGRPVRDLSAVRVHAQAIAAAVEAEDTLAYVEADRAFHHAFVSAAGNDVLTETVMGLRDRMRFYGMMSRSGRERQLATVPEHFELIALAETGKAAELARLLRSHILSWKPIFEAEIGKQQERRRLPFATAVNRN